MIEQLTGLGLIHTDILFIDDNSPDGTGELLDSIAEKYPDLTVKHRTGKLGIGSAHKDGIRYALENNYDVLITMDCDFTHPPADIPRLIEASSDHDLVITSRFMQERSLESWSLFRKKLTFLGHFVTKLLFGIEYDASGAFRLYKLSTLNRGLFARIKSDGYSFFLESLLLISHLKYRIAEIPIVLPARSQGHSKMKIRDILIGICFIVSTYLRLKFSCGEYRGK